MNLNQSVLNAGSEKQLVVVSTGLISPDDVHLCKKITMLCQTRQEIRFQLFAVEALSCGGP